MRLILSILYSKNSHTFVRHAFRWIRLNPESSFFSQAGSEFYFYLKESGLAFLGRSFLGGRCLGSLFSLIMVEITILFSIMLRYSIWGQMGAIIWGPHSICSWWMPATHRSRWCIRGTCCRSGSSVPWNICSTLCWTPYARHANSPKFRPDIASELKISPAAKQTTTRFLGSTSFWRKANGSIGRHGTK